MTSDNRIFLNQYYTDRKDERQKYDLVFPKKAKGNLGLVLCIHGGGWVEGNKNEYTDSLFQVSEEKGVAAACKESGCALIGGETAEMNGFYPEGEYDIAGFAVGCVEKSKMINSSMVKEGDVILGLPSTGVHSNGYSLVRKVFDIENAEYLALKGNITVSLLDKESKAGTNYYIPLDIQELGGYEITVTASSTLGDVAQLPCTLYYTGVPFLTFTFNGTEGKPVSISKKLDFHNRMAVIRLNVAKNGLKLEKIEFRKI